jgi:hypothetical protein
MPTVGRHACDTRGCTAAGDNRTVTGGHLCEHCYEARAAEAAACMAGNGATAPLAFVSWWRRLFGRAA